MIPAPAKMVPVRNFMVCFCLLLFLFIIPGLAFSDTYNETEGSGLSIDSMPRGAKVFIDGVERGTTPFSLGSIRAGEYLVRVYREGYAERRFRVIVRRGSRVEISVDLEEARGRVLLEVRKDPAAPPRAVLEPRIYADGSRVHETELSLAPGWRTITVEAFGWEKDSKRIYVAEDSVQRLEFVLVPAAFMLEKASLRKSRFNPANAGSLGTAEIRFEVTGPGRGALEVRDARGRVIHTQALGPFAAWEQEARWNGKNGAGETAADGIYTLSIAAWGTAAEERQDEKPKDPGEVRTAEFTLELDSSLEARPLSFASASSGLFLASSPEALPAFSWQIEGMLLAGKPPGEKAWESLPYALGFRLSFMDKLETAAAFNAAPRFDEENDWGLGVSLKWVFSSGTGGRMGAAAEFSWGWAKAGPRTAFGTGTGPALRFPLGYRVLAAPFSLDILASPFVLWAGPRGYPQSPVPRLGIGGGVLAGRNSLGGGLSVRWDYGPEDGDQGPLVSALELKYFPSNAVFSLVGGLWTKAGNAGAFFGAGIGVIY